MIYTPEYFLKKFEAIPEELWCTECYEGNGRFCALGHCGEAFRRTSKEATALRNIFYNHVMSVSSINDGNPRYPQPTPKLRILAALTDIINKQKQS